MKEKTNRFKRGSLAVLVLLLFCGVASVGSAQEISIEGHLHQSVPGDGVYEATMGEEGLGGAGMLLGVGLPAVEHLRGLILLGSQAGQGESFNRDLTTTLQRTTLQIGVDYRIPVIGEWFRPLVRATGGYSSQRLELMTTDATYADQAHGLVAFAGGGLELLGSLQGTESALERFSFGGTLLFGYLWQTESSFHEMTSTTAPSEPTEQDPWSRSSYDAGALSLSGFTWSLGAQIRYRF